MIEGEEFKDEADKYIYYVAPMFNRQPLVYPRPAASASAAIPCVWQCVAHDLHHHFVRLRFSRRMPLFNLTFVLSESES